MIAIQTNSLSYEPIKRDVLFSILQIFGATLFLAICAQIRIPLYCSPVPLTGQTFGIMLIGATMGSRKGLICVLAYIAEGCLGLPVFAGGAFGLMSLIGPTGGYFLGFLSQVYIVGCFVERQASFNPVKTMSILLASIAIQLGLGVLWLSFLIGMKSAVIAGLCPFLVGEAMKSLGITLYLKRQFRIASR